MKYLLGLLLTLLLMVSLAAQTLAQNTQPTSAPHTDPKAQAKILDQYGKLPLSFEANQGQTDTKVKFLSRTSGYTLFLTGDEAVLTLRGSKPDTNKTRIAGTTHNLQSNIAEFKNGGVLRMKLLHANPAAKVTGAEELPGTSNYFIGNDPAKWRTGVPTYAEVKYEGIYSGIDLVYYGNQRQLEYDFIVAPGVDPRAIQFDVRGAKRIHKDEHGDLVLKMGEGEIRWHKPVVYQEKNGARQEIAANYAITDGKRVGFEVAKYDASRPLYIDPLVYSTYLGGSSYDQGFGIAVDSGGNVYVTGDTESTDFPTQNPLQPTNGGGENAFVTKINASGSALVYSTYLGGSGNAFGRGIAVDSSGNAYVTGGAGSNFPLMNPIQAFGGGGIGNAFVAKLNSTGSALVYSTYLGGSGGGNTGDSIALDTSGNSYVTGVTLSTDFPVTPGAYQTVCGGGSLGCYDVFVSKINPSGSAFVYSTYLGGTGIEEGFGIAVDGSGNAYVTGGTQSTNFPTTPGAFQTVCRGGAFGCYDAFASKINPTGSALVYSTYLGGSSDDYATGKIAVDSTGSAYVDGTTYSTDFPVTPGAFQTVCGGGCINRGGNAFVTKINPSGSGLVYSTYLGGSNVDDGEGIAVDSLGNAYVTGLANSTDFPTMNPLQAAKGGNSDAYVAEFNPEGSALVYSTYLGGSSGEEGRGIALDSEGNAYITGATTSTNFPTLNALQPTYGGGILDAFVTKIASVGPRYSVCLLYDPTKAVHSGATIPIKLQLCDSSGNDLSSSSITVHAISVTQISTSASGAVENAGNSNPDNDFRFDATLGTTGGYIFNLKTTGLSTGTYKVNFTVTGDSFVYAANFEVK